MPLLRCSPRAPRDTLLLAGVLIYSTMTAAATERTGCRGTIPANADVAQLVEHFTRNEGVPGSSPGVGSVDLQGFYEPLRLAPGLPTSTDRPPF
jgi:hypothetical protein